MRVSCVAEALVVGLSPEPSRRRVSQSALTARQQGGVRRGTSAASERCQRAAARLEPRLFARLRPSFRTSSRTSTASRRPS